MKEIPSGLDETEQIAAETPAEERKLISLNEIFEKDKEIIDKDTFDNLGLSELAEKLISKMEVCSSLKSMLEKVPTDTETIRLRQDLITNLISGTEDKEERSPSLVGERLKMLETLQEDTEDLLGKLNFSFYYLPHLFYDEDRAYRSFERHNLGILDDYLAGNIQETARRVQEFLAAIPADSALLEEFKSALQSAIPEIDAYAAKLKELSGIKTPNDKNNGSMENSLDEEGKKFKKFLDGNEIIIKDFLYSEGLFDDEGSTTLNQKGKAVSAYAIENKMSNRGLQRYIEHLVNNRGKTIADFRTEIKRIGYFITAARVVLEFGLGKIDITDENGFYLEDISHPLDSIDPDVKWTPTRFEVTPDKPTVMITGDNATGKTKLVETIMENALFIQALGYGFARKGRWSPRNQISFLRALGSERVKNSRLSRGEREMEALKNLLDGLEKNNLTILDETLTSTDSIGALALTLAAFDKNSKNNRGLNLMTLHSRYLETVHENNLCPNVGFQCPEKGKNNKKTYQWKDGVEHADPVLLAKSFGFAPDVLKDARTIQDAIEKAELKKPSAQNQQT